MANELTAKRESFCLNIVKGMSQIDAYRAAYDKPEWKDNSVYPKASELMKDGKIQARIDELRKPAANAAVLTLESHLRELDRLAKVAESLDNPSAAIKAQELRGKAAGLYVDRSESKVEGSLVVEIVKF